MSSVRSPRSCLPSPSSLQSCTKPASAYFCYLYLISNSCCPIVWPSSRSQASLRRALRALAWLHPIQTNTGSCLFRELAAQEVVGHSLWLLCAKPFAEDETLVDFRTLWTFGPSCLADAAAQALGSAGYSVVADGLEAGPGPWLHKQLLLEGHRASDLGADVSGLTRALGRCVYFVAVPRFPSRPARRHLPLRFRDPRFASLSDHSPHRCLPDRSLGTSASVMRPISIGSFRLRDFLDSARPACGDLAGQSPSSRLQDFLRLGAPVLDVAESSRPRLALPWEMAAAIRSGPD